jgi:DNA-binding NarL/FixJ family response regulator
MDPMHNLNSTPTVINSKPLTRRQEDVLIAICCGRPYRQVSRVLGMTEGSLKVYMSHLMGVTGKNRTELALIGYHLAAQRAEAALPCAPPPLADLGTIPSNFADGPADGPFSR